MEERQFSLQVEGLKLSGAVYIPTRGKSHPVLCLCHGIPAQVPDPTDKGYPLLAQRLCNEGFVTLIFNFRGTGASEGNLDLAGWTRDLAAVLDYLYSLKEVDKARIALMGFSAGAAAAVYTAAQDKRVSFLVLCACPSYFRAVNNKEDALALLEQCRKVGTIRDSSYPPSLEVWMDSFRLSPIDWIDRIAPRPLLLIHGEKDELIDVSQARELYRKAGEPKEVVILEGASHRLRRDERVISIALAWLKKQTHL